VAEILPHVRESRTESADAALLRLVNELAPVAMGVDAPLTFPPCLFGCEAGCAGYESCDLPAVRWMRENAPPGRDFPPYAYRPVDILLRGKWQEEMAFPFEESFGAGRAPLAARMQYLRRHLRARRLLEVHPRLALHGIADWYGLDARELRRARDVEEGAENRASILAKMSAPPRPRELPHLFLYNADLLACAQDLDSYDGLLCGLLALFGDLGLLAPPEFDPAWGHVARPRSLAAPRAPELGSGR
jgi:hypothetical protein